MSDLVDRQGAMKQFCNQCKGQNEPCEHHKTCKTMKVLRRIPSAEPNTGHWSCDVNAIYHCSECGCETTWDYNFCPDCGADMRGEQE